MYVKFILEVEIFVMFLIILGKSQVNMKMQKWNHAKELFAIELQTDFHIDAANLNSALGNL